jgi:hypothetical protein
MRGDQLAGISVEYYVRLERGAVRGASEEVLEGIARALQLDEAERLHLFDLVRAAGTRGTARRRPAQERVRPVVHDAVGILRAAAGRDPYDKRLSDLIGELSTRSEGFRIRWAAHNVTLHRTGVKRFHHPVVGELTLDFESLDLPGDPGRRGGARARTGQPPKSIEPAGATGAAGPWLSWATRWDRCGAGDCGPTQQRWGANQNPPFPRS